MLKTLWIIAGVVVCAVALLFIASTHKPFNPYQTQPIENLPGDPLPDRSMTATSTDGRVSIYYTITGDACQTHITHNETHEDTILKTISHAAPEDCAYFCEPSLSPDGRYVIESCGTSPVRDISVWRIADERQLMRVYGYDPVLWPSPTTLLVGVIADTHGWREACTDGGEANLISFDTTTMSTSTLKKADGVHSHGVHKLLPDGSIYYVLETAQTASQNGSFDCSQLPATTNWAMDAHGTILRQLSDQSW